MLTPFQAFYIALKLNSLNDEDALMPVFSEGNIRVYPYQVAAAVFAMRNPYHKGVILCDEAGMGKSHEAMLIANELWYEGKTKILIAIPNGDLLMQWAEMIEDKYSIPYCIAQNSNIADFDGIVLATNDYIVQNIFEFDKTNWDTVIFEEANVLSSVYQDENAFRGTAGSKQAKILKEFSKDIFKILLTGTPIEKNIMDLYGLIYFIDEDLLPDSDTYMKRYLRRPENYPELAEKVSKYCFRTLRSQAKRYAKIPERRHITLEYEGSEEEKKLYNLINLYIEKPDKKAFPKMDKYDLALMLLGTAASSSAAITQSLKNIIKRLEQMPDTQTECEEFKVMLTVARQIKADTKIKLLADALEKLFPYMTKNGANRKAVIFTESVETQKCLYDTLKSKYKTLVYNGSGSTDYEVLKQFKNDGEILISTDIGAKGYNLEEASLVVNYDLLYNTLKMEQRIDRAHRIGQQNDCIVLSFINKGNFADIRKLELVSKRYILTDGVFGVSDSVIGGFADDIDKAIKQLDIRKKAQVEKDYQNILKENEADNKELVESAEDILFTTFTKEMAEKIKITPQYAEEKGNEIKSDLWELVKYFFEEYNLKHDDCKFVIDEDKKTVTATNYKTLPHLFYYPTNNGNRAYTALKQFKNISLLSPLAKGLMFNTECSDSGTVTVDSDELKKKCSVSLYMVTIYRGKKQIKSYPLFAGKDSDGNILSLDECERIFNLPVKEWTQDGKPTPYWLKSSGWTTELNPLVDLEECAMREQEKLSPMQQEEVARLKQAAVIRKNKLNHTLDDLSAQLKELIAEKERVNSDRLKLLTVEHKISLLNNDISKKKEGLFFDEMRIDVETEKKINEFLDREEITAKAVKQFMVEVINYA